MMPDVERELDYERSAHREMSALAAERTAQLLRVEAERDALKAAIREARDYLYDHEASNAASYEAQTILTNALAGHQEAAHD